MAARLLMIRISSAVRAKLASRHSVRPEEVEQCFENREGKTLLDTRPEHHSDPPTRWFIAETNQRRVLKIVFIPRRAQTDAGVETQLHIRSAFEPNDNEIAIYQKYGKSSPQEESDD